MKPAPLRTHVREVPWHLAWLSAAILRGLRHPRVYTPLGIAAVILLGWWVAGAGASTRLAEPPAPMDTVADKWANAVLTAPVGKLPPGKFYEWGCQWYSNKPRTLRCHFDVSWKLNGVVRRGWWDVVYQAKTRCETIRFEDRSGRLAFRQGCIAYGMRPDGFVRIPPRPDPAP